MSKLSTKNLAQAIHEAIKGKSGGELNLALKNSAKTLADKRMLGKSGEVLEHLQKIVDKEEGTVRMKITSAKALSGTDKHKLEHDIKERYKAKHIESEYLEDKEALGGIRVEVGEEVMDNTWRAGLNKLEKALVK